ncbi:hypothetical protein DFJ74DRAFT_646789 [Hyaloraphidium curvatum]|nr:hypothetical protein DFJ74DRAFT_646789 [Hyaloraphidium curvatum]
MDLIDPGASSFGTKAAVWTLFLLTLPTFLASNGHLDLPISRSQIRRHFYFTFSVPRTEAGPQDAVFSLHSPPHSLFASAFHHDSLAHLLGNTNGLFWNAINTDAGFLGTLYFFLAGGAAGTLGFAALRAVVPIDAAPPKSWFTAAWTVPRSVYSVCGSSAAVYSLMGAGLSRVLYRLRSPKALAGLRREDRDRARAGLYMKIVGMGLQAYGMVMGASNSLVFVEPEGGDWTRGGAAIAHEAHLAGFAFGFLSAEVGRWMDWG